MNNQRIIGVCGLIGSGKGSVADMLVKDYDFVKISFADKVKDGVAAVFDIDRAMLEGDTKESRESRNIPDKFWSAELNSEVTPRLILQLFGTECMRSGFYDGVWTSIVKRKLIDNPTTNFVIPDARFSNEMEMIKSMGGEVWQVRRGELPEWWNTALLTNTIPADEEWIAYDNKILMENKYPNVHASEYSWVNYDANFTHIIQNDSTLEDLAHAVKQHINK